MRVMVCDRCGKIIKNNSFKNFTVRVDNQRIGASPEIIFAGDLCLVCRKVFKRLLGEYFKIEFKRGIKRS